MYIFDIDGTLLDSIGSIHFFINDTLKKYGLGEVPIEKVQEFVGNGPRVLVDHCMEYVGFTGDEVLKEEIYKAYNAAYDANPTHLSKPYDGIREELDKLKNKGEIIAAFSNKPDKTSNRVLNEIFGTGYFDYILGYREDYKRKPSPEGIMIIAERFAVNFSDIYYFGDSEVDMKCGKNASIFTVGCSWGFRDRRILEAENPDAIIDNPREITSIQRV